MGVEKASGREWGKTGVAVGDLDKHRPLQQWDSALKLRGRKTRGRHRPHSTTVLSPCAPVQET